MTTKGFGVVCGLALKFGHQHFLYRDSMTSVLRMGECCIAIASIIIKREDAIDCLDRSRSFELDHLGFLHGGVGIAAFIEGTVAREKSQYVQYEFRTD